MPAICMATEEAFAGIDVRYGICIRLHIYIEKKTKNSYSPNETDKIMYKACTT